MNTKKRNEMLEELRKVLIIQQYAIANPHPVHVEGMPQNSMSINAYNKGVVRLSAIAYATDPEFRKTIGGIIDGIGPIVNKYLVDGDEK